MGDDATGGEQTMAALRDSLLMTAIKPLHYRLRLARDVRFVRHATSVFRKTSTAIKPSFVLNN